MTIVRFGIPHASHRRLALALAIGLLSCAGDDTSQGGQGGAGGSTTTGHGGSGGSSGNAGNAGSGASGGGGSAGTGGSSGASGSAGRGGAGGTAGVDGSAGAGGAGSAGKGGAGGAAGIDGSAGAGGAAGSAGKGDAGGAAGVDGGAGAGGTAGSPGDAGPSLDAARDAERDLTDAATDVATDAIQGAQSFHCVNWADPRDNFVNGNLELSGLSVATDTYATVQAKANDILTEFQTKVKADSIRIPINEPTVSGTWWAAYKGVIDTAVGKGMKVVIAYWAYQNGRPANDVAFKNMWQVVVSAYQNSSLVYFDIHNEPYGYGSAWNDAAAQWLADFPGVPRGRVIVAGTGYDDNVNPVGSDARFAGCILQLHIYGFWHTDWTAKQQWTDSMKSALGPYAARTLAGEWGAPMTTGTDYGNTADGDAFRSYVIAVSNVMHDNGMGSCYWPGLRNGDSYSMTKLNGSGTPLTLTVNSTSGLARLHWAWKIP